MIKVEALHKSFGAQVVLDGIDVEIDDGETLAIVGPSGTGKSVLLKIVTGLLDADSGEVLIDGESITGARNEHERRRLTSRLGVLFQNAALLDSISLFENVAFPLRHGFREEGTSALTESEIQERTLTALDEVDLLDCCSKLPGEVSIGMRKRVGIARALVTRPSVILFDEPNTGLDPQTGQEIYELIKETEERLGFTGIVVSHEIPEVFQVCNRVIMLYQGKIQLDGTIEEFLNTENPLVRQFIEGRAKGPLELNY